MPLRHKEQALCGQNLAGLVSSYGPISARHLRSGSPFSNLGRGRAKEVMGARSAGTPPCAVPRPPAGRTLIDPPICRCEARVCRARLQSLCSGSPRAEAMLTVNATAAAAYGLKYSCASGALPPTLWAAIFAIATDRAFWIRCAASGVFATLLYCGFGLYIAGRFPREVCVCMRGAFPSIPLSPPPPLPFPGRRWPPSCARAAPPCPAPLAPTGPLIFGSP